MPVLVLLVAAGPGGIAQRSGPDLAGQRQGQANTEGLLAKARAQGSVRVIVEVGAPFRPEGMLSSAQAVQDQRLEIQRAQQVVLDSLAASTVRIVRQFQYVPYMALEVDEDALAALVSNPNVASVQEDVPVPPTLTESIHRIGADAAWVAGYSGSGQVIAILDTGVDNSHEFLLGKVVSEACYSTTYAPDGATSFCPGGVPASTANGSGVNCPSSVEGCDHGTHVAGIAAGTGASFSGVAKDADLIAIQIFSRFTDPTCSSFGLPSPCALSYTSDQIAGLERVYDLHTSFAIAAANMSLGGGRYTAFCDSDSRKPIIDTLRSVDIATVIASGNSGYTNALGAPACISSAISVGSTNDYDDIVSSFSNVASFLDLYAPGEWITSSVPGDSYATWHGTSMAAPHVAGAWAVLRSMAPGATVQEILTALSTAGIPINDTRPGGYVNGIPRIQVDAALAALGGPPPTPTPTPTPVPNPDTPGTHRNNLFGLRNSNSSGYADIEFVYGLAGDLPIAGDWNGDGVDTLGVFRNGVFYLRNSNTTGYADITFGYGLPGDLPIAGDWNGDGIDTVGVFRNGVFYLRNSNTTGYADITFGYGLPGDLPVAGDWDLNSIDTVGGFRNGVFYLRNSLTTGYADVTIGFGLPGDLPIAGDWNADGVDTVGAFRNGVVYLKNSLSTGYADVAFGYGLPGDRLVVGDWDGLP